MSHSTHKSYEIVGQLVETKIFLASELSDQTIAADILTVTINYNQMLIPEKRNVVVLNYILAYEKIHWIKPIMPEIPSSEVVCIFSLFLAIQFRPFSFNLVIQSILVAQSFTQLSGFQSAHPMPFIHMLSSLS